MQLREIARLDMKTPETDKKSTASKTDYEEMKKRNASRRKEERKIERAKVKIEELEAELEELDCELFGEAATNYLRAAEIDRRKAAIEEELLELYDLVM
jgi:superfamily II RNA helicase